jgi:hypothetical protein
MIEPDERTLTDDDLETVVGGSAVAETDPDTTDETDKGDADDDATDEAGGDTDTTDKS